MEKLMYAFWRGDQSIETIRDRFTHETANALKALGAERLQLNVCDFTDMSGTLINFTLESLAPRPDGLVSFWLSSAWRRAPVEQILRASFARIAGYVVAESTILPNIKHPSSVGERTFGFSQVTFLQIPPRLTYAQWRKVWFEEHTSVGIDTQANFRYVQNVVVMPLTADCPPYAAIVEEGFSPEAMRDPHAFYGSFGDEAELQKRMNLMMQSCAKLIDFDKIDVIATSEYRLQAPQEPAL
jgi:hypothetical protein